jgi:hypothetical protein
MNILEKNILSTKNTPEITLDPAGIIIIRGRSMSGNVSEFVKEIENWINKYISHPAEVTSVDFHLEYLNTNNIKIYISLLKKLETIILKNKKLMVNWYYEEGDEDIFEKGECIFSQVNVPFNFIMISDLRRI